MFNNIKQPIFIIFLLMVVCFNNIVVSQEVYNDTLIQWINQFPADKDEKPKASLTKKITNFIVGEDEALRLIKPMSVIALNQDSFIVFDQEQGLPFYVKNLQPEFIKSTKKRKLFFPSLVSSCYVKNDGFVFTDSKLNKIFYVIPDHKEVKVLNDSLKLVQPTGIAYSKVKEEIWVVETAAHRISVINLKGELLKQLGKRGTGDGEFNFPTSIWIDNEGFVYVIDAMNYRVQIFDSEGKFMSSFGKQGDASGYFARPKGIATDSYHNIYVTDALFHTVQIFDKEGKFLYNFGEQGRKKGQFWIPSGIYIDRNDYIYIADTYNARVQIFKINSLKPDE